MKTILLLSSLISSLAFATALPTRYDSIEVRGNIKGDSLTASRAVVTDASKNLATSAATSTEVGYLAGVTSGIQTQINAKQAASLADGKVWIGVSGTPTAATPSGDVTISNAGVTAIGSAKVTNGMLAGSISASKLIGSDIATVGTVTSGTWNGTTIDATHGGTGQSTWTLGDFLYASAANTLSKLAGNTAATKQFLTQTGNGSLSAAPAWGLLAAGDIPSLAASIITSGQLAVARGGTGQDFSASTGVAKFASGTASVATVVDADISGSAAIARSKLANGTAGHVVINDASTGALSSEVQLAKTRGGTGISSTATFPSSGTVVTEAATETLTGKLYDGGTASNTSAFKLSKDTTTNLAGLTREQARIYFDTTLNKPVFDDGSSLTAIGTGSGSGGGINFIGLDTAGATSYQDDRDLNSTVGQWAKASDAAASLPVDLTGHDHSETITCTRGTTNPLDGAGSLLVTLDAANRQGEMCMVPFNVQPAYQGAAATVTFQANVSSGALAAGDLQVFVYNSTKSVLITPWSNNVVPGLNLMTFPTTAVDPSPVNHAYRLAIYRPVTSATAVTLKADNFSIAPGIAAYGATISDWVAYTPTLSAGFGSASAISFYYRQVGDSLQVSGTFTTGTLAASIATISLPTGLAIDSTKVGLANTTANPGYSVGQFSQTGSNTFGSVFTATGTSTTLMYIGQATNASGALVAANGVGPLNSNAVTNIYFTVPIVGWKSNGPIGASSTFRISSWLANGSRVTGAAPTALGQYRSYLRNVSANTFTETNGSPTTAPTSADGIVLYRNTAWGTVNSNNQPTKYDIFVGKNKNIAWKFYSSTGFSGNVDITPSQFTSAILTGWLTSYDPTTGVATVVAPANSSSTTAANTGFDATGAAITSSIYADIVVSENALMVGAQKPRCTITLNTPSGAGSTNTKIRRYTVTKTQTAGTTANCFSSTVNDATNGSSIQILEDGLYQGDISDNNSGGSATMGFSVDSAQLTTSIYSITDANYITAATCGSALQCQVTLPATFFRAGQVVRHHAGGTVGNATDTTAHMTLTKISD